MNVGYGAMADKKTTMAAKPGQKPRSPGAGWVVIEVSTAGYQYLQKLVHRTGLADSPDGVAAHMLKVELLKAMKDPTRYEGHPDTWHQPSSTGIKGDD